MPETRAPCLQHLSMLALSHSRVTGVNSWCGVHGVRPGGKRPKLPTDQQLPGHDKGITSALILSDAMSPFVATGYRLSPDSGSHRPRGDKSIKHSSLRVDLISHVVSGPSVSLMHAAKLWLW